MSNCNEPGSGTKVEEQVTSCICLLKLLDSRYSSWWSTWEKLCVNLLDLTNGSGYPDGMSRISSIACPVWVRMLGGCWLMPSGYPELIGRSNRAQLVGCMHQHFNILKGREVCNQQQQKGGQSISYHWSWWSHYNDVIMSAIQAQTKENNKAPRHWPLCGKFTVDRWISRTKDQ